MSHPNFLTLTSINLCILRTCCKISLKLGSERHTRSVRIVGSKSTETKKAELNHRFTHHVTYRATRIHAPPPHRCGYRLLAYYVAPIRAETATPTSRLAGGTLAACTGPLQPLLRWGTETCRRELSMSRYEPEVKRATAHSAEKNALLLGTHAKVSSCSRAILTAV